MLVLLILLCGIEFEATVKMVNNIIKRHLRNKFSKIMAHGFRLCFYVAAHVQCAMKRNVATEKTRKRKATLK